MFTKVALLATVALAALQASADKPTFAVSSTEIVDRSAVSTFDHC